MLIGCFIQETNRLGTPYIQSWVFSNEDKTGDGSWLNRVEEESLYSHGVLVQSIDETETEFRLRVENRRHELEKQLIEKNQDENDLDLLIACFIPESNSDGTAYIQSWIFSDSDLKSGGKWLNRVIESSQNYGEMMTQDPGETDNHFRERVENTRIKLEKKILV